MNSLLNFLANFDYQALLFFNSWIDRTPSLDFLFKFLAVGLIYIFPFLFIIGYFWSQESKKVMVMSALSGVFCWQVVSKLVSIFYFRARPSASELIDLKEIIFHRPDYSFPSDHAMFVASVAVMFWLYGYKKLSYWTGGIGILIVIMRVVVAVHYPLDIVAGLILGSLISWALFKNRCFMEKYIVIPIEKIIFRLIKH